MHGRAISDFAAALLPPERGGPPPEVVAAQVRRHLAAMPAPSRLALLAGFDAVRAAARTTTGRSLPALSPDQRTRVLDRVARTGIGLGVVEMLKAACLLAWGAEHHRAEILARGARFEPARPDADLAVTAAREWPGRTTADVTVVGSGAGGAIAARALAARGLDVVVVEEGERHSVDEFRRDHPMDRFARMYRDAGTTVALGWPPVVLPIGRAVGGSTVVNSGTCYRPPPSVLRHWRDDHGLAVADPDSLGPHVALVESLLRVGPAPLDVIGRNAETMLAGAERLGWSAQPLRRNAPGCQGSCQCAIGCPNNAKLGVHLSVLPDACRDGARILSGARVDRVVTESGRAVGIEARRPDGGRISIRSEIVVVAAGTSETPPLLRRSGLGAHPGTGRRMAVHPALSGAGWFTEEIVGWEGVLQSAAVEEWHESEGILVEATATPPGMGSMILPGYGSALVDQLGRARHLATLGAMIADAPSGRVHGSRRSVMSYRLAPDDTPRLLRAIRIMGEVLFAAGAEAVLHGVAGRPPARSLVELDAVLDRARPADLHLAAFHPTGSMAAGADPERHPVAPDGRLRAATGVWVTDASVLPSSPTVNPQISIMAMASALAAGIAG